jgi:hypothetical protein
MTDPIRTEPVFDALKQPLAFIEGDDRRRAIETYIEAARLPVERAVFDLMAQLTRAVDERVGDRYRIRLAYHPDGLQLEIEEKVANSTGEDAQWATLEGDIEKITIRIPAELKDLATQAAQRAGTSANTWFVKAMARAVRNFEAQQSAPPPPPSGHRGPHRAGGRFTGWVGGDDDEVD